jgi:signal transduction histidine kinase
MVRFFSYVYSIPFLLEGFSLLLFILKKPWLDLDDSFFRHGLVLYGIIFFSQILLYSFRRSKERLPVLLFLMSAALVLGYALGEDVQCEMLLYAAAIFSSVLQFPFRTGIFFGLGYGIGTIFLQHEILAWERVVPGPELDAILFLGINNFVFLLLAYVIVEARKKIISDAKQMESTVSAVRSLTSANIGFQRYADTIVEHSLGEERRRISRELHDTMGYSLTNIRMMMEEAIGLYDGHSEDFVQLLVYTRDQAKNAMDDARSALKALRSTYADHSPLDIRAVQRLAKAFTEATHVDVRVDCSNTRWSYGNTVDHFVYRFVQEGMTNSFRHGKAEEICIYLFEDIKYLHVSLIDDGQGCKDIKEGVGISGMRERIKRLGGAISLGNSPHGFSIHARIALKEELS